MPKEPDWWPARYVNLMREAIEELGGPRKAVSTLGRRGIPPIDVAIALLGGVGETAKQLKVSRQTFNRMMKVSVREWDILHGERLEELTGIKIQVLVLSAEEAAKLPDEDESNGAHR